MGLAFTRKRDQGMLTVDDFKVGIAAVAGLFNWAVNIDIILQLLISLASLTYILLKIREIVRKR